MELTMEFSSHFGNPEFNELIAEILKSDEIKAELDSYPWLKATVRQWIDKMQSESDQSGYYSPVKRMSSGSRQHLMAFFKADLMYEIQKKHFKQAQIEAEKAKLLLKEHLDMVEDHNLEKDEVVLGGMFTGQIDKEKYLSLVRELVDYSLTMAGLKERVSSMDVMAEYVHASRVRDYIQDLELCLAADHTTTLQDLQAALESSETAREIARDESKPRPVQSFAEMISLLVKSEGSDNLNTIFTNN